MCTGYVCECADLLQIILKKGKERLGYFGTASLLALGEPTCLMYLVVFL